MECVVCYDPISSPREACCSDPACLGGSAVCAPCSATVERCVYCREPRRAAAESESENFMARVYLALYYASVIVHTVAQVDASVADTDADSETYGEPDDPGSDSESESESMV